MDLSQGTAREAKYWRRGLAGIPSLLCPLQVCSASDFTAAMVAKLLNFNYNKAGRRS